MWCPSICSLNLNFLIRNKWEGHSFIYSKIFLVYVLVKRSHIEDTILNKSNALPVLTKLGVLWNLPKRRWEIALWYVTTTLSDNQYVRGSHGMSMQTRFYSLRNISWKKWSLIGGQSGDQKCYGFWLGGSGNRIVNIIHRRENTWKVSVTVAGTNKVGGGGGGYRDAEDEAGEVSRTLKGKVINGSFSNWGNYMITVTF